MQNKVTKANRVNVGNYFLSESQIDRLKSTQFFNVSMQQAQNIAQRANKYFSGPPMIQGKYIYFANNGNFESQGALRVSFDFCPVGDVSVIARSHENTFEPFEIDKYESEGAEDKEGSQCDCCCCFMCACAAVIICSYLEMSQPYHLD